MHVTINKDSNLHLFKGKKEYTRGMTVNLNKEELEKYKGHYTLTPKEQENQDEEEEKED
jgi:hypothetical protein